MFAFTNDRSYMAQATPTDWLYYLFFKTFTITTLTLVSLLFPLVLVRILAFDSTDTTINITGCGGFVHPKVKKVIRKLFKQVTLTFLTIFLTIFAYNLTACFLFLLWRLMIIQMEHVVFSCFIIYPITLLYYFGFLYLMIVSQLAGVVSALEEGCYGVKGMIKGMDLVKGKRWLALDVSFGFNGLLASVAGVYMLLLELEVVADLALMWHVGIGILCCVLFMIAFLGSIVNHASLYLICKSDHRDKIVGKVSLSNYLGAYMTDSHPAFTKGEEDIPQNEPVSDV